MGARISIYWRKRVVNILMRKSKQLHETHSNVTGELFKLSQLVPNYYFSQLCFKGSLDLLKKNTTVAFSFKFKIAIIFISINTYINLYTSLSLCIWKKNVWHAILQLNGPFNSVILLPFSKTEILGEENCYYSGMGDRFEGGCMIRNMGNQNK